MIKQMYITVGTSLFESATWEPTDWVLERCPDYKYWCDNPHFLDNPESRRTQNSQSGRIRDGLRQVLREGAPEDWAQHLPPGLLDRDSHPTQSLRYSSELTTLIKMAQYHPEGEPEFTSLRQCLESYHAIFVITDEDQTQPAALAAAHLVAYLQRIVDDERVASLPVPWLSSTEPSVLLDQKQSTGLGSLIKRIRERQKDGRATQVDLIATGGYKVYGIVLAQLVSTFPLHGASARLIYVHESGEKLMIFQPDKVWMEPAPGAVPTKDLGLGLT